MSAADTKHPGPQGASGGDGLSVTGLSVAYGTAQVLHEVSFDVAPGEILGIVGESGCGKSTLAYALGRHLAPGGRVLGGSVQVDGADVLALHGRPLRDWRARQLAVVHQDAAGALDPTMRIGAQLGEVLRRRGLSRAAAEERAVALLRRVRLPHPGQIARRYPHQLSGGQQQRVVIAAALAVRPRLLVLDEPTTGLDASVEHEVLGLLAELCTELRAATVFISHDLGLVGRLCDRVGVLYAGRLVELGEAGPVLEAPSHPYTSALLSSVPVLGVTRRESPLRPIPGRLPLPGEAGQGCSYAPRCPLAGDGCRAGEPALDEAAVPGRAVRCLRAGEPLPVPAVPQPGRQPSETASRAILEVRGLVRRYGDTVAVDQVDLTVRAGEVVGLVGESGSGKTTLARAVAGLGHGGAGRILLHGREVPARLARRDADTRRRVQMVFQNPDATLNPSHRVRTVLERAIATLADPEAHVDIGELTDRTHIDEELLAARPAALSGGQKQRVAIARSLAGHPDLVICDEPVSALDASVQAAVLELLAEQRAVAGTSYLFISHDLAVVGYLADRIAVMYRGAILEEGPAAAVLHGPSHPYTATLVDAATRAPVGSGAPFEALPAPPSAAGCRFAGRCERRIDGLCDQVEPPVRTPGPHHEVRCHLDIAELPVWRPERASGPGRPTRSPLDPPSTLGFARAGGPPSPGGGMTPPAADTHEFTELLGGFAEPAAAPAIQRRWVTVVTGGGHVSGVFWHTGTPGTVLLHDTGLSARSFDAVLRAYGRPAVAVDLPGHGRSAWRRSGDYRPRRLAKSLEETVLSYAPGGPVVAGRGLGALAGIALAARFPAAVGRLVLIDTLPGSVARGPEERWPWPSPAFGSRAAAAAWLHSTGSGLTEDEAAQHAALETVQTADGRWVWRHHLAELDGSSLDGFHDDTLWTQLAAVRAPVLIRAGNGALAEALVDRFRTESQDGEVVELPGAGHRVEHDGPDALAELLGRIADRR